MATGIDAGCLDFEAHASAIIGNALSLYAHRELGLLRPKSETIECTDWLPGS
ncbi:MAG: hypothetical protein ACRDPQ_15920 [Nocardioidaceae bacterium]